MIGQTLKTFREYLGLNASTLSLEVGISNSMYSQIENGKRQLSLQVFNNILSKLIQFSTITELNKDVFINETAYKKWRMGVGLDNDPDDPDDTSVDIYETENDESSYIGSFERDMENLDEEIEKYLRDYFFNFSYKENYYFFDYKSGKRPSESNNRFARKIPIVESMSLDGELKKWWRTYYVDKLIESCQKASDNLTIQEKIIYRKLLDNTFDSPQNLQDRNKVTITDLILAGKRVEIDLSLLRDRNVRLLIDNVPLSPGKAKSLDYLIEGMKQDLQSGIKNVIL
ncbi:helix-turn-helix domain-containing protein [Streptococcus uberis]|uniref:helix-turn-helix domain-containing protein n=1 Tax=Streptococcus uberis TaxID=1349 RepID=UPI0006203534|nr:helix-turn-helix transcriptional regulator [Streptococcus uberis]KKF45338.1 hypothetical protein AF61_04220 [Streptococcus uberis EF20/0145]